MGWPTSPRARGRPSTRRSSPVRTSPGEIDADPVAKEIIELAQPLEGLTTGDSIHAAGVVIGSMPLMERGPGQRKGAEQEVVTQFSGGDVEALGLLEVDFLGLRNLDVIATAERLVGDGLDVSTVALDDRRANEMLSRGEASGVFRLESSGMREALRQVKPTEFEDLIALVALYRPGPMQYVPAYAARKHGRRSVSAPPITRLGAESRARPSVSASTQDSPGGRQGAGRVPARLRRTISGRRSARISTR